MFRRISIVLSVMILLAGCGRQKADLTPKIVPQPEEMTVSEAVFQIKASTPVCTDGSEAALQTAAYFTETFRRVTGWDLSVGPVLEPVKGVVLKLSTDAALGTEGYRLNIGKDAAVIEAADGPGLFYGVQSLFQLLPPEIFSETRVGKIKWKAPGVSIEDRPRFPYRGMHLDVCRHFFDVNFVKRYIDYLAMHKLNRFHWHLTEDQGWRIEIKKYPKLQSIASKRKETVMGKTGLYDGKAYGGYYTQDEVREVVAYAAARHITVIPEIEMPGHSVAALAAYPELSCNGGPFEVRTRWGVSKDIYCAGKEETFEFLENVLTEVMALFPSEYIHIGGDEAPKDRWNMCGECRKRMREEHLQNAHQLQSYFIKRIEKFLNANGRQLIGWDEILEGGLAPEATVMSWRGTEGGIASARQGHDVIMTPYSHLYFDGYQADRSIEPLAIGYWAPMERVYAFEPVPEVLSAEEAKHILGAQANLWTEYIATDEYAEYMALPRMSALSEVVWSPKDLRDWDDFSDRMQMQYRRLDATGAAYRVPTPVVTPGWAVQAGDTLTLLPGAAHGSVRYTTDGTDPNTDAGKMGMQVIVHEHMTLRAQTVLPNGRCSSVIRQNILVTNRAPEGYAYGLDYTVYSGKVGPFMPNPRQLKETASGASFGLDLKAISHPEDQFYVSFDGALMIPEDGTYTFHIHGDDGARLRIDGKRAAGHDRHAWQPVMGNVYLTQGAHPVKIEYFEHRGAEKLTLEIEGPGLARQPVPPWMWLTATGGGEE